MNVYDWDKDTDFNLIQNYIFDNFKLDLQITVEYNTLTLNINSVDLKGLDVSEHNKNLLKFILKKFGVHIFNNAKLIDILDTNLHYIITPERINIIKDECMQAIAKYEEDTVNLKSILICDFLLQQK